MKQIFTFLVLFLFIFVACRSSKNEKLENELLGEWSFFKFEDKSNFKKYDELKYDFNDELIGYNFKKDHNCTFKKGFIKTYLKNNGDLIITSFENQTKYKIEYDTLKIFDLKSGLWINQKIYSIQNDTLVIMERDSAFSTYLKVNYKVNSDEVYDKIIFSSSGCYGSCPIISICLESNGNVLYNGYKYNTKNGLFTSKISIEEYGKIQEEFKKANILSLDSSYQAPWSDDEQIQLTFVKDNKIIKTISDYGRQAPKELVWTYMPLRFLYQRIDLQSVDSCNSLRPFWKIDIELENQAISLTNSEGFYLYNEIQHGREVSNKLKLKYKLKVIDFDEARKVIYTDGQYFRFADKTIDIGYNFLKSNYASVIPDVP